MSLSKLEIREQFSQQNYWRSILAVAQDFLILAICFYLAYFYGQHFWVALPVLFFIGVVQFAMCESLVHEASHNHLFENKALNRFWGNLFASIIFTTLEDWAEQHRDHHGYLMSEKDHLTEDYHTYQLYKGHHPMYTWVVRPLLGFVAIDWLKIEFPGILKPRVFLFHALTLGLAWWAGLLGFVLLFWYLPLIWVQSAVLYWSEITDHYLSKSGTRSNLGFFWNFFYHNGGYHWVHHEYPYIPFHRLPEAHKALTPPEADAVGSWWQMYLLMLQDYKDK